MCCLRAARDKLPRGRYAVSVSLHSCLGAPALAWGSEKTQHQLSVFTEPVEHLGRYYNTDLHFNQSVLMVRTYFMKMFYLKLKYGPEHKTISLKNDQNDLQMASEDPITPFTNPVWSP